MAQLQQLLKEDQDTNKKELADVVDHKVEIEEKEQQEFIETIKDQYYDEHLNEIQGVSEITKIVSNKAISVVTDGFQSLKQEAPAATRD